MADQEQQQEPTQGQLAATFPNPPPFWKDFTAENVTRMNKLWEQIPATPHQETLDPLTRRMPGVPDELVNLQPPAEPANGKWRVFGDLYSVRLSPGGVSSGCATR